MKCPVCEKEMLVFTTEYCEEIHQCRSCRFMYRVQIGRLSISLQGHRVNIFYNKNYTKFIEEVKFQYMQFFINEARFSLGKNEVEYFEPSHKQCNKCGYFYSLSDQRCPLCDVNVVQKTKTRIKKIWVSINEINKETGYDVNTILQCCTGKRIKFKNYYWRFF
jgi:hypothetical protein